MPIATTIKPNITDDPAAFGCLTDYESEIGQYVEDLPHSWSAIDPSPEASGLNTPTRVRCSYCQSTATRTSIYTALCTDFKASELLELKKFQRELKE